MRVNTVLVNQVLCSCVISFLEIIKVLVRCETITRCEISWFAAKLRVVAKLHVRCENSNWINLLRSDKHLHHPWTPLKIFFILHISQMLKPYLPSKLCYHYLLLNSCLVRTFC
jgi:hypothetical protein